MQHEFATVLEEICKFPPDWHEHGTLSPDVLQRMAKYARELDMENSMETGTGKSTLLLSHCSKRHIVFTVDDSTGGSLDKVRSSPLFNPENVEFVVGPSQQTLRDFELPERIQFALLDGPHAYPFPELEYYAVYPRLVEGAVLVIDDIHIPTVNHMFEFLREDAMFDDLDSVRTTGFLRRTAAPMFDPMGYDWTDQSFNDRRFPEFRNAGGSSLLRQVKHRLPEGFKKSIKRHLPGN